jgi:hypothetical protein
LLQVEAGAQISKTAASNYIKSEKDGKLDSIHTLVALLPNGDYFGTREPPKEASVVLTYDAALKKLSPYEQRKLYGASVTRSRAAAAAT